MSGFDVITGLFQGVVVVDLDSQWNKGEGLAAAHEEDTGTSVYVVSCLISLVSKSRHLISWLTFVTNGYMSK